VDKNINVTNAARRIVWGRFSNSGQTCIAPDYVLCHKDRQDELLEEMKKALLEFYGKDPQKSDSYSRIVNKTHFNRVKKLVETSSGQVVTGGVFKEDDLYISPTIISNPAYEDAVMTEEVKPLFLSRS